MEYLFASGRIVDFIFLMVMLEAALLAVLHGWFAKGPGLYRMLPSLLAGLCLMIALRLALTGAAWGEIAAALVASLVAHLADLLNRWRSS